MATFYTDADLTGAGEFIEPQVSLATEFTLPAGQITRFRWPFPAVAPSVTPAIRLYDAAGTRLASVSFDTATLGEWNWATPASPISVAAGTYRVTVTTTRYPARTGFFSGGPITRDGVTAVQGRFTSGDAAPTSTSTATYFVDVDFAVSGQSVAPAGLSVPVVVGSPVAAVGVGSAPDGVPVPVVVGGPSVGWSGSVSPGGVGVPVVLGAPLVGVAPVVPDGVPVPVAVGTPSLGWSGLVTPAGVAVPVSAGSPATTVPGAKVHRPSTGVVQRPGSGTVVRPDTGVVSRP